MAQMFISVPFDSYDIANKTKLNFLENWDFIYNRDFNTEIFWLHNHGKPALPFTATINKTGTP